MLNGTNVYKIVGASAYNQQTVYEMNFMKADDLAVTSMGIIQFMDFIGGIAAGTAPPGVRFSSCIKDHFAKVTLVNTTSEDSTWKAYIMRCVDNITIGEDAGTIQTLWSDSLTLKTPNPPQVGFTACSPTNVGQPFQYSAKNITKYWRCVKKFNFSLAAGAQRRVNIMSHINKVVNAEDVTFQYDATNTGPYLYVKGLSYKLVLIGTSMPMSVKTDVTLIGRPSPQLAADVYQQYTGWETLGNVTRIAVATSTLAIPTAGPYTEVYDDSGMVADYATA